MDPQESFSRHWIVDVILVGFAVLAMVGAVFFFFFFLKGAIAF